MTSHVAAAWDTVGDKQSGVSGYSPVDVDKSKSFTLNQAAIVQFKLISVISSQRFICRIIPNITKSTSYLKRLFTELLILR